jgi:protein-S-isoprenylcysteine O-methyltransferase Ste14
VTQIALPSPTPIVGGAADLLAIAGLIIALWGRIVLGRNWNMHPGLKENHELIERGPYAYVRHPMYSGLCLMFLGTMIWSGHKAGYLVFFACLLGAWFKLRQEEKILTRHFGESYLSYKARVKALIPFVL